MSQIEERLAQVQAAVDAAQRARGPGPKVRLIAVSKYQPASAIEEAYRAGHRDFGENYVQEFEQKAALLAQSCPEIRWHMIGALQRNKVAKVLGKALIHTVDRASLVDELQKRAKAAAITQDCLIQVNPGESQKAGVDREAFEALVEQMQRAPDLRCRGVMLIPPQGQDPKLHFSWLSELAQSAKLEDRFGLCELSMGMSGDFEQAIAYGASYVRVGTAIFGPRPGPQ